MLELLFSNINAADGSITAAGFFINMGIALVLGALLTFVYTYKASYTKSFAITLATLPAIVAVVIMMVSGSLGAGVAVAGTFSLVRFRSVPGTAKEIGAIFLSMAVGLACGMGYPGFAVLFSIIMCAVNLFYNVCGFGEKRQEELKKTLNITVPEDLDYAGIFEDLFGKYTSEIKMIRVKTTNLGSLNRLTYNLTLKKAGTEKALIDEIRCRNGNLEISMSIQETGNYEL